jgi:hypothetical protein
MSYISSDDILDTIVSGLDLSPYLAEVKLEIEDLAEQKGVRNTDDIADPIHYKLKRYGICYVVMRLCQDKLGLNDVSIPELEKYKIKYDMYRKECSELRDLVTYEMITGKISAIRDRAISTGLIFRGS